MFLIIKNLFRGALVVGCGIGIALLLGLFNGEFNTMQLIFYTVQSNLVIFLAYGFLLIKSLLASYQKKEVVAEDFSSNIMGALTLMIVVTGAIYNFVLAPTIPDTAAYSVNTLSNFLVHTYTPLMVLADWLIFVDNRRLKEARPYTWVVIPLIYWVYSIIRAQVGGPIFGDVGYYPYFFIDADLYGWPRVFLNVLILLVVFLVLGYLMVFLTKQINRLKKN